MTSTAHNKRHFPILARKVNEHRLVYLDSSNTSFTPSPVLKAMDRYYRSYRSNIHRAVYPMAEEATEEYESAREKIREFIGAQSSKEIIFTRNATEGINLVARTWARKNLKKSDGVLLTIMEHHSNIVPWLMLKEEIGIRLHFVGLAKDGMVDMKKMKSILRNEKIKLVSVVQESNVLGVINPIAEIAELAHQHGALILVDGSQAAAHRSVNVRELDVDFYVFTGHKMLGPTGIGVLYTKEKILNAMPPFLGGGDMIREVHESGFLPNELPYKFEAGTPNIAGAIGLGAAVHYLQKIGMVTIERRVLDLTKYALKKLSRIHGITLYGPKSSRDRGGIISFNLKGIHPHDVATLLGEHGICVRAGHHCAQPLMEYLGIPATVRVSFYFYNTRHDIDLFVDRLRQIQHVFSSR